MCRDKTAKPIIVCNALQVRFEKERKQNARQLIIEGQGNGYPGSLTKLI